MNKQILKKIIYSNQVKIKSVLQGFEETAVFTEQKGFAIIINEKKQCIAVVTDGDIRKHLINGGSIENRISRAMNKKFKFALKTETPHQMLRYFDENVSNLPVLDKNKKIIDLVNYSEFNSYVRNEPRIIRAKVPVRVSFSGGGTDFSSYIKSNNTGTLSTSINKFIVASILIRPDSEIHIFSRDLGLTYSAENLDSIKYGDDLDLIKAAIKLSNPNFGFDLEVISDVEPGTGLGGSSAVAAATIGAINFFKNEASLDLYNIADLAYQAERIELKMPGGWQDQYATTFGGFNWIDFTTKEIIVNPLKIATDTLLELQFNLLLFRLGGSRESAKIQSANIKSQKNNAKIVNKIYRQMLATAIEMRDTLLRGHVKEFGDLLNKSWEIKKQLGKKISNRKVDKLYNLAIKNGALGGKLLGAGGSGYMVIYASPLYQKNIIELFEKNGAKLENFTFTKSGLQTWSSKR